MKRWKVVAAANVAVANVALAWVVGEPWLAMPAALCSLGLVRLVGGYTRTSSRLWRIIDRVVLAAIPLVVSYVYLFVHGPSSPASLFATAQMCLAVGIGAKMVTRTRRVNGAPNGSNETGR